MLPPKILHTRCLFSEVMQARFATLHARTICHATEDPDRVEQAIRTLVGDAAIESTEAEGHYGNRIMVMEVSLDKDKDIVELLSRLSHESLREICDTIDRRLDDSCNLFVRLDKQEAFRGILSLSDGDDVIALRIKIRAFPAKREDAASIFEEFVREREC
jgi:RNA binding exosome subunit